MSTPSRFQIVTANALETGDVVYLTGCDEWSPNIMSAEFIDASDHAEFRLFVAQGQTRLVVDAHLAEVEITDNGPVPLTRRESLRANGPSTLAPAQSIAAE